MTNRGNKNKAQKKTEEVTPEETPVSSEEAPTPSRGSVEETPALSTNPEDYETVEGSAAPKQFQSEDAQAAAAAAENPGEDDSELAPAKVTSPEVPRSKRVVKKAESNKMVKIRPRQSIPRLRIGRDWYQLIANKDCLVPRHVADLLEQKGYL